MELIALAFPDQSFGETERTVRARKDCFASLNGAIWAFADWWHITCSLFTLRNCEWMVFSNDPSNPILDDKLGSRITECWYAYRKLEEDALSPNPDKPLVRLVVDELGEEPEPDLPHRSQSPFSSHRN
jgi:hypothetical protein